MELPPFPPLNQRQTAAFLGIEVSRLERATHVGTVERRADKLYDPVPVTAQWLAFERARTSSGKRRSTLEREKAALTKARRELVELRLSSLRGVMVNVNDMAGALDGMPIGPKVPVGSVPVPQDKSRSPWGVQNAPIQW
jgi:hypothetical protein